MSDHPFFEDLPAPPAEPPLQRPDGKDPEYDHAGYRILKQRAQKTLRKIPTEEKDDAPLTMAAHATTARRSGDGSKKAAAARTESDLVMRTRKTAEEGDGKACFNMGIMCESGEGVEKDEVEAVRWFMRGAKLGYARAQCNLGLMYEAGRHVKRDLKKAVKYLRRAAEQGDTKAQVNLGTLYSSGRGCTKSWEEAAKWYRSAAESECDQTGCCGTHLTPIPHRPKMIVPPHDDRSFSFSLLARSDRRQRDQRHLQLGHLALERALEHSAGPQRGRAVDIAERGAVAPARAVPNGGVVRGGPRRGGERLGGDPLVQRSRQVGALAGKPRCQTNSGEGEGAETGRRRLRRPPRRRRRRLNMDSSCK